MKVLSLFDGMSCGQIALNNIGIKPKIYYAAEIKKHAIKCTMANFPNTVQLGDVTKIDFRSLGHIDLLIGGSPCQDLSQANKERKGLEGAKSSLFWEYVRALNELRETNPDVYFLLENVEMPIEDKTIITEALGVQPVNINSSLVTAQLRNRYYWTNIPGDEMNLLGELVISQPQDRGIKLQDILENGYTERDKSVALTTKLGASENSQDKMIHRYETTGMTTLIFKDAETYLRVKEATKQGYIDIPKGSGVDLTQPNSETRRCRLMDDKSNCLMAGSQEHYVFTGEDIRYFTQTELERLQGIPGGYTKMLSRNQAANLIGDGWTIPVIEHIFRGLK